MKKVFFYYLITSFFILSPISAQEKKEETVKQLKIGNLALATSQRPGPLIGFGQNIVDKGDFQAFVFSNYLWSNKKTFIEIAPSILYGIKDNLSIFIESAYAAKFKINNNCSKGMEDLLVQLEYAFYDKDTITKTDQITLVTSITLPTGSVFKNPPTGFGAPGFFLGFTASRMATDWYYFTSAAVALTMSHNNIKSGNQFLYQFGLSKNISYKSDKWIFNWMIELDGTYMQRNKIAGKIDPNSGGNTVFLGASLWFSTQRFILQAGISGVISQHLFGIQKRDKYLAAIDIGWKF